MIAYKDVFGLLKAAGWSTYRIRREGVLTESTLQRIRDGRAVTTDTIDAVCRMAGCRVEDVIEYREDPEEKGAK